MTLFAKQGGLQERTSHTYARTHVRTHIMRGRYLSPRVISAYYTPSSKSRRSLTLCNAFLRLRRKKALDREKIDNQARILELQRDLIVRRDTELKAVQNTVQTGMKSYSSVLAKNCSAALAPKKIEAAVRTVADKDDRSKNVIIYGLEETDNEKLNEKIETALEDIGERPVVRDFCRVGVKRSEVKTPRPIKFTLTNSDHVNQILRSAKQLHSKEGYRSVYICPDRTAEERRAHKKLMELLKEKRAAEPNRTHFIRNNKVMSFEMNSDRTDQTGKR